MSPGAATGGVTPIFFLKKTGDLFLIITVLQCHPYLFSPEKLTIFFSLITVTFIGFTRVSPPGECHPAHFYLADLVCPLFLLIHPQIVFLRVAPPEYVTRGGPSLVTPLIVINIFKEIKLQSLQSKRTDRQNRPKL